MKIAEEYAMKALNLKENIYGKEHPATYIDINNLATILIGKREYERAVPLFERTIEMNKKIYGPVHQEIALNYNNIAHLYFKLGNTPLSIHYYLLALETGIKSFGKKHPETANFAHNLAQIYFHSGDYKNSLHLNMQAFQIRISSLGIENTETQKSLTRVLSCFLKLNDTKAASTFIGQFVDKNSILYLRFNEEFQAVASQLSDLAKENLLSEYEIGLKTY